MAKLQKGLEDYFRIPVLLKPIGETPVEPVRKLHQILKNNLKCLVIDDRYEAMKTPHSKLLQKREKNVPQILKFMLNDFNNEWGEFQVIYRCRFCVGVFSSEGNLSQQWTRACKIAKEENRKMVGLMILSGSNCNVQGIKEPYIIVPQKLQPAQYNDFLQPWLFAILPAMEDHICLLINQLQKEDNGFIVFNKVEEKPEPRTLKKKKRGRCLKICGDFCLILYLIKQAYAFFIEAEDILKKVDDYLWVLGCNQGKLACFTTDETFQGIDKESALQSARLQSLSLSKKIKIPQLETENYFKILKIYTKISQSFDEMSLNFLNYVLNTFSSSQKFSILTQLAMLYKEAGMFRKHNYMLYLAARIAIDLKPSLVGIILNQILKSGHVKQWPLVNANVIKLLIDNTTDSKEGQLHLGLLENCCTVLTERDVAITVQALQHRNFHEVALQNTQIFELLSITCKQSQTKPRANTIAHESPVKSPTGFFMNWRKKETIYKFQQQQPISFQIKARNNMKFPLRCSFRLHFTDDIPPTQFHSFFLQPNLNKISLKHKFFQQQEIVSLKSIQCKIYNFTLIKEATLYPAIRMEIYEQYPVLKIQAPVTFHNEESSLFEFPLKLARTKPYIQLAKLELTISVYYNIDVGYQETPYHIKHHNQQKYMIVLSDYPYESCLDNPTTEIIRISPLRAHKKHIKKIECKLDAIASQVSKYQISAQSTTAFIFERSIWCQLVAVTSPMKENFGRSNESIIEDQFIIKVAVHKKEDDLTPYRINEGKNSYTLSQSTSIIVEKVLNKLNRKQWEGKPLQMVFEWCNSTREKQCGTIQYEVESHPLMFLSNKLVEFQIEGWNGEPKQKIKSMSQLSISYIIDSTSSGYLDLSHSFAIEPRNLPTIQKYIVLGKTKIKTTDQKLQKTQYIKNKLRLKLFYEYAEEYMFGIRFEDGQIYWFPCLFAVVP